MAALPYMPLFVADYLADTAHLTTIQHGAYMLLIMNYWQRGKPLPNDDSKLARIVGLSVRNWQQIKAPVVEMFGTGTDSGTQLLYHQRINHELDRVASKSLKSKKAAQASVQRRFGERSTDAERALNHTEAHTDTSIPLANANGVDPEKVLFDQGLDFLKANGVPEKRGRPWLGKLKRDYETADVISALGRAKREGVFDVIPWVEAALQSKAKTYDPDRITV